MSLVDELITHLTCPGCSSKQWDLRAAGVDDLPSLEGTLCCGNCGQAFAARGGVLDMVPEIVEDRLTAVRRRIESPPVARLYEETFRHVFTPLSSTLRTAERSEWLREHAPTDGVRAIVDFGCGRGSDLELMREASPSELALGIDLSTVLLAEAARSAREGGHKNMAFIRANLEALPFDGALFGWGSCYGVLHRLSNPRAALAKAAALLLPGASFTCLTTMKLPSGVVHVGQQMLGAVARVHVFSRDDLKAMFEAASLELLDMKTFGPVALLTGRRVDRGGEQPE